MRDLHHAITLRRAISPQSVSDNTALVGQVIDRQGFDSAEFVIATGNLADADATFAVLVEEGDAANLADAGAVAAADLLGTVAAASFQFDDDDSVRRIGYRGGKRYLRLTITPAGNSGAALIAAVAVLGHPARQPTA